MQYGRRYALSASGDALIARLYEQYALTILASIHRHVPSREEAEDILLEVFLAALQHRELAHFSEKQQRAWLQRVAVHKCVDAHRRAVHRMAVPLEVVTETLVDDECYSPDQLAVRHEEEALLYEQLTRLSESYQQVLQLRFAHGLRCAEIARRLNKSEGAIRMILSRALTILRDVYARQ